MTNKLFWVLVSLGLIAIVIINTILFPRLLETLKSVAPDAKTIFDLTFYSTVEESYRRIESFGEAGIPIVRKLAKIDFAYIVIYVFTYFLILRKLVSSLFKEHFGLSWLVFLPFGIGFFDAVENFGYLKLIAQFPNRMEGLAILTTSATMIKWTLVAIVLAFFVFLIGKWIQKNYFN